jgi:GNAT superfamily N-acetyltransferase
MPEIRPARPDELRATTDIRREMVRETDGEDVDETRPGWRERHEAFYTALISAGRAVVLLAVDGGTVVGMAAVYELDNHRSVIFGQHSAVVSNVYVAPHWRRKGLGTALTERAIEWARNRGCIILRLRPSAAGKPMYESMGFRISGELQLPLR